MGPAQTTSVSPPGLPAPGDRTLQLYQPHHTKNPPIPLTMPDAHPIILKLQTLVVCVPLSLVFLAFAAKGIRDGQYRRKNRVVTRIANPGRFWFTTGILIVGGLALLFGLLDVLLR